MPPIAPTQGSVLRPIPHPKHPKIRLRLHVNDLGAPASLRYLQAVESSSVLADAVTTVLSLLYPDSPHTASDAPPSDANPEEEGLTSQRSTTPPWPGTRSVTLIINPDLEGVAVTSGISLDNDHKEISIANAYIESLPPNRDYEHELTGVIVHEMVHCWQWDAKGTANGGLIEGIADWVRLRAGLAPPHWKARHGKDDTWDSGYAITAYFLEWLEGRCGKGAVMKLNGALREVKYEEEKVWKRLFGAAPEVLWEEYCKGEGKWEERQQETKIDKRTQTVEEGPGAEQRVM